MSRAHVLRFSVKASPHAAVFPFPASSSLMHFEQLPTRVLPTQSNHTPDSRNQLSAHPMCIRLLDRVYHDFRTISAPGAKFATSTLLPTSCLSICLTSSLVYFLVFTDNMARPVLSLSSSCALIQHLAIRFCAISIPPGKPAARLPPRYQGF